MFMYDYIRDTADNMYVVRVHIGIIYVDTMSEPEQNGAIRAS